MSGVFQLVFYLNQYILLFVDRKHYNHNFDYKYITAIFSDILYFNRIYVGAIELIFKFSIMVDLIF